MGGVMHGKEDACGDLNNEAEEEERPEVSSS